MWAFLSLLEHFFSPICVFGGICWSRLFACATHCGVCKHSWPLLTHTFSLFLFVSSSPYIAFQRCTEQGAQCSVVAAWTNPSPWIVNSLISCQWTKLSKIIKGLKLKCTVYMLIFSTNSGCQPKINPVTLSLIPSGPSEKSLNISKPLQWWNDLPQQKPGLPYTIEEYDQTMFNSSKIGWTVIN